MGLHRHPSSPPLQISILTQFFPPDYAATGQLVEELAQSFSRQGVGVQVFVGQPGYAYDRQLAPKHEMMGGVMVRRTRTVRLWPRRIRGRAVGGVLYCLRSLTKLVHPSRRGQLLLVTTEPPYLPILAYLMHRLFGQPYLCVVYDLYPEVAVALGVVSPWHWLVRLWRRFNYQAWCHAEAIVVLSHTMKQRIIDHCPQAQDKTSVIHNWADPTLIVPQPKANNWFAQKYGLDRRFTVLYSGNIGRCHDMDTILAAALALRHEPVQFVFIGAGAKRQPCETFVQTHGLTNCLFLPYQAKETLPFSLTACDLSLVSLVRGVEGLVAPSKLYGSLAAGRPVAAICEPHSYLRSLLQDGGFGQAFDNGDGAGLAQFIRQLRASPELVETLGQRGRHYLLEKFTPQHCAQRYVDVIGRCTQMPGPVYAPSRPKVSSRP